MHCTLIIRLLLSAAIVAPTAAARAQDPQEVHRTPLASGHPMIGTWRIDVPGTDCTETYAFSADGTMRVHSGSEVAESEFEISAAPSAKGYYTWLDKITKDNGKADCTGETMQVGHVAMNYILFHPSRREFLLCQSEDLSGCIGPFKGSQGI